jgi:hypothetical protein
MRVEVSIIYLVYIIVLLIEADTACNARGSIPAQRFVSLTCLFVLSLCVLVYNMYLQKKVKDIYLIQAL